MTPSGYSQKQLQFTLNDKTGKPRHILSAKNGHLTPLAIQRSLDEHNRDKNKALLREGIDRAIQEGRQPDEIALALKERYGFDTKSSLRKIGEETKTILSFSRMGQVKPISNNHLEEQYSTRRIIDRCRSANPSGHVQYLNRIKTNTTLYPIQINDQGFTLRTAMRDDLLTIRDQSRTFRQFLDQITQENKYRWNYIAMNERGQPTTHQDHSGTQKIDGIGFGIAGQQQLFSGTTIDKELSYPVLQRHFAVKQTTRQSHSVSGGSSDPKVKNTSAPVEQAPRIISTAGQVAASMEAQQNRIQADLDKEAAEISRQERDARTMEMDRRDHQPINSQPTVNDAQKPKYKKIRKRKRTI